jgi:hypothetical protein
MSVFTADCRDTLSTRAVPKTLVYKLFQKKSEIPNSVPTKTLALFDKKISGLGGRATRGTNVIQKNNSQRAKRGTAVTPQHPQPN